MVPQRKQGISTPFTLYTGSMLRERAATTVRRIILDGAFDTLPGKTVSFRITPTEAEKENRLLCTDSRRQSSVRTPVSKRLGFEAVAVVLANNAPESRQSTTQKLEQATPAAHAEHTIIPACGPTLAGPPPKPSPAQAAADTPQQRPIHPLTRPLPPAVETTTLSVSTSTVDSLPAPPASETALAAQLAFELALTAPSASEMAIATPPGSELALAPSPASKLALAAPTACTDAAASPPSQPLPAVSKPSKSITCANPAITGQGTPLSASRKRARTQPAKTSAGKVGHVSKGRTAINTSSPIDIESIAPVAIPEVPATPPGAAPLPSPSMPAPPPVAITLQVDFASPEPSDSSKRQRKSPKKAAGAATPVGASCVPTPIPSLSDTRKVKQVWGLGEDERLRQAMNEQLLEAVSWTQVAEKVTGRTAKQCRERWRQHLAPSVNKNEWTPSEDQALATLVEEEGTKWVNVARRLGTGRSDGAAKNRYVWLRKTGRIEQMEKSSRAADDVGKEETGKSEMDDFSASVWDFQSLPVPSHSDECDILFSEYIDMSSHTLNSCLDFMQLEAVEEMADYW